MNNENKNYCENCRFLSLTEEEQQKQKRNKEDHICKLFNRRIFHGRWHPELCRLPECFDMENNKNLPNSKIVSNLVLFKNNKATFLENVRIEFNNDGLFCENEKDDCGNFINFKYVSRCFSIGDTFYLFYKE